ncbi:MAG TPA: hypothetical protein VGC13_26835 [Longimicrobium sp.]|jgi:DNA phosphorothioation-dependent restriction protein DptG|uniref:hypothetical protein n=1 Tax=Longimicrobium sp. TaxID=2029185 RepID=UPI002EDAB213
MTYRIDEPWTAADDAIEEVREIRRKISEQFDHDPVRLVEYYMEVQKQYADRLADPRIRRKQGKSAA